MHPSRSSAKVSFYFPGIRSGESAGGSLVGIVPSGFTFTGVSGTFTWAGEEVEMFGKRLRHSLRLLPGTEPSHLSDNKQTAGLDA